ncbi:MAG: hypothetical protein KAU89_01035 [Candidatus Thorarchaeota archaeon]|nr:hypothetical protein [Candidatus Thorarchaeota archaeon]
MTESSTETPVDPIRSHSDLLVISLGVIIQIAAFFNELGFLFLIGGFVLTCFGVAASANGRSIVNAQLGIILGVILNIIGIGSMQVPLLGVSLYVIGRVMILFYAIPLAVARNLYNLGHQCP